MTTLQWPHRQQKLTHVQTGAAHCDHFTMATHTTTATKKPTSAAGAQCQENTTGLSGAVGASVQAALRGKADTSNANSSDHSLTTTLQSPAPPASSKCLQRCHNRRHKCCCFCCCCRWSKKWAGGRPNATNTAAAAAMERKKLFALLAGLPALHCSAGALVLTRMC